ncbi:putative uncharacterized protein DDB_G0292636 [Stomoxys calcitrans]|uniref:WKF domain-containing protein n=1 Tax=Stomoxys calcitrans TaxID=35570 RepID=A0A1I8PK90_STOCA|nr:putative uncharacterized protein DDB_G0292636 [Stomoxys calcitrans]
MAKLEASAVKKQKAKKRKNPNPEHEDEIANKSIILENTTLQDKEDREEKTPQESAKKSKKRKNKEKGVIKEKRTKSHAGDEDTGHEEDEQNDNEEDDIQQPTLEQLKESEKPENNLAIVTGRQKKKQKHLKLLEVHKGQSMEKEKQRNEEYLKKWKDSRDVWKFEKLRQISIQQTMLEEHMMSPDLWVVALEYLGGSKGAAKEKITKIANDVIDEIDTKCENNDDETVKKELVNSVKYQRARDLLQIFD